MLEYSASELREIFGPQVWESGDGLEVNVQCPYCVKRGRKTPDASGHLGLNFSKGVGHCVRCGWSTKNLRKFLRSQGYSGRVTDADAEETHWADQLRERTAKLRNGRSVPTEPEFLVQDLDWDVEGKHWVPVEDAPSEYRKNLAGKGLTTDICRRWRIMSCVDGKHEGYNIFPFTEFGDLCYWQGRAIWKGLIRKHSPPLELGAGSWVYNYPDDRATTKGRIGVVTEGTLDCISVGEAVRKTRWEHDFWPVSIQGTALTFPSETRHLLNSQYGKLKSMELKKVLVLLDPEERKKTRELCQKLTEHGLDASPALYPNGADPNKLFQLDRDSLVQVLINAAFGIGKPLLSLPTPLTP